MEMLKDLLALSHVPRWTTHPVARPQNVADHSFRVTVIAMFICDRLHMSPLEHYLVMRWCLVHDGPEAKTGDIPKTLKRHLPNLHEIETDVCPWYLVESAVASRVEVIAKLSDWMEALSYLRRYGSGFVDRFDGEKIEDKYKRAIANMLAEVNDPQLSEVVGCIMSRITA